MTAAGTASLVIAVGCAGGRSVSPTTGSRRTPPPQEDVSVTAEAGSSTVAGPSDDSERMSTFLASLAEAQAAASVDVAFPSLDYVRTASGSVAVATLTGAHAVDLAQEDTAPCGDDRTAASTCVTKYAFALVRFEFTVESIRPFGTQHPAAVEVGDQVSFTRGIGVVGTNRPDLDADVERARQAVVAGAPIGTRSVIFMRSSPVSKDATVTEWTLVGADGSLTSTYVPAPDDERPLWTDATRDLEALATLQ